MSDHRAEGGRFLALARNEWDEQGNPERAAHAAQVAMAHYAADAAHRDVVVIDQTTTVDYLGELAPTGAQLRDRNGRT